MAGEGWGVQLLSHQDDAGRWTRKLYGYKWTSTTYSIVLLRRMGLPSDDPRAERTCRLFLDEALWPDGGINISMSLERSETCATGMVLALLAWFAIDDPRRERLVDYLLVEQMPDGGWNCERFRRAAHSSFHTTRNVLEGLRVYAAAGGPRAAETATAEVRGREFLLEHRMYRSHRTGDVVDDRMTRLSFPCVGATTSCGDSTTSARGRSGRRAPQGCGRRCCRKAAPRWALAAPAALPGPHLVRNGASRPTQPVEHAAGATCVSTGGTGTAP